MKNKITEFKHYLDLEKELAYINKRNAEGWKLVYIKAGCLYTFVRTEPGEYFTILHAESKDKVSSVAAFAAQCGYESIPHTMDGIGDMLYLTGKKDEVSDEFVSDNESKIRLYQMLGKRFKTFGIIYVVLTVVLALLAGVYALMDFVVISSGLFDPAGIFMLAASVIVFAIFVFALCATVVLFRAKGNYNRKLAELAVNSEIYE